MLTDKLIFCLITTLFKDTAVLFKSINVVFTTGQNLVICVRTRVLSPDFSPLFKHMFDVSFVGVMGLLGTHTSNIIVRCWIQLFQRTPQPKCEQILHPAKV